MFVGTVWTWPLKNFSQWGICKNSLGSDIQSHEHFLVVFWFRFRLKVTTSLHFCFSLRLKGTFILAPFSFSDEYLKIVYGQSLVINICQDNDDVIGECVDFSLLWQLLEILSTRSHLRHCWCVSSLWLSSGHWVSTCCWLLVMSKFHGMDLSLILWELVLFWKLCLQVVDFSPIYMNIFLILKPLDISRSFWISTSTIAAFSGKLRNFVGI